MGLWGGTGRGSTPAPTPPWGPRLLSLSLSTSLCPSILLTDVKSPRLLFPSVYLPPVLHTPLRSSSHSPAARPHQPCLRKPQWAEAGCSHSDWQAGARGGSHHHTRTGSHTCIPCPGKGSPAGSGTGSSGLSSENRWARLRCGPSPHASTQRPPQTPRPTPRNTGMGAQS